MKRTNLRIGCLLLVLVLLLSVLPVTALAADTYTVGGTLFINGDMDHPINLTTRPSDEEDKIIDFSELIAEAKNLALESDTNGAVDAEVVVTFAGKDTSPDPDSVYGDDDPAFNWQAGNNTCYFWLRATMKYGVTFNTNGGTAVNSTNAAFNTAISEPIAPTKDNYTFAGWYTDPECQIEYDFKSLVTKSFTLYAKWIEVAAEQKVIVTFESKGGSEVSSQEIVKGGRVTEPTAPTRFNYKFTGWYKDSEAKSKFDFSTPIMSNLTLYAGWEYIPYRPSYQLDAQFPSAVEVGKYQDVSVSLSGVKGCENYENVKLAVEVSKPNYSDAELWYLTDWGWPWNYDVVELGYIVNDLDLYQTTVATYPLSLHVDREGWYTFTFKLLTTDGTVLSEETATLYASYPAHDDYRIYLDSGKHGSISTRPSTWADYKDTVTVYVTPDKGYELDTLKVYDARGNRVSLYTDYHGNYYFTMPNREVTVYATFREIGHFTDVPKDSWYYDAVYYVYNHDIMDGIGNRTFNPYGDLSRAMIVTTLYRLEGEPAVRTSGSFRDVPANTWYSDAVEWAAKEGIVKGYGKKTFGPSNSVTVEQLAAILQRYADYKGYDVSDVVWLYADAVVSDWAVNNVRWAAAEGLLRDGRSTNATKVATRAEIAYALYGFMVNVAK